MGVHGEKLSRGPPRKNGVSSRYMSWIATICPSRLLYPIKQVWSQNWWLGLSLHCIDVDNTSNFQLIPPGSTQRYSYNYRFISRSDLFRQINHSSSPLPPAASRNYSTNTFLDKPPIRLNRTKIWRRRTSAWNILVSWIPFQAYSFRMERGKSSPSKNLMWLY